MRNYFQALSDGKVPDALVTVCVPVYNGEPFLQECLESIRLQTHSDLIAIVVDNCSVDGTAATCATFDDSRFFYVRNDTNLGALGNHNRCLDLATSRYVKLLSADDVLLPDTLTRQVGALEKNRDAVLATCNCIVTDSQLKPLRETLYLPGMLAGRVAIARCAARIENLIGGPSNTLLRRQAVGDLRFDPKRKWLADLILHCQLLRRGDYINIDQAGFLYRRHAATDSEVGCPPDIRRADESFFVHRYARSPIGFARLYYRALRRWWAAAAKVA